VKRVFTVNNGFTERMVHHVIATSGFSAADCLLLYIRRGSFGASPQVSSSIRTVCYDNSINHCSLWRINEEIRKARDMVANEFGGEDYICYAHHTRSRLVQALIGAEACTGYYVVEEGMGAYVDARPESIREALQRWALFVFSWGRLERFGSATYGTAHRKFLGAIAASEEAFPGVAKKQVVGWPFSVAPGHDEIEALLVLEGPRSGEPLMRDAIRRFAEQCWQGKSAQITYKFHPRQGEDYRGQLRSYLEEIAREYALEFVELPEAILEDICFTRGQSLSVYFITSSVGFYGARMGCRAVSLAQFYGRGGGVVSDATAASLRRFLENLPQAFASRVQFI
jgi:hypothetical protein